MEAVHRLSQRARAAIEDLVTEHAWVLDHGDPATLPDLYTDDGELLGLGQPLRGRADLTRWAANRATMTERTSRHVHTNLRLQTVAAGEARGSLITLLYRHDGEGSGPTWPMLVLDYADRYRQMSDETWRFESRSISRVFVDRTRGDA